MLSVVTDQAYAPLFSNWLATRLGRPFSAPDVRFVASVLQEDDQFHIVGVTALDRWTASSCEAHAASDGSKRQKIDRAYIYTTFDYVFRHAGKNCLITHVATDNVKSLALQELLGFNRVGQIDGYYGDGADAVVFSLNRQQWLDGKWGALHTPTTGEQA